MFSYYRQLKFILSQNINKYFKNADSNGPILIERENGPDNFIGNVRADAYERISQVLV